MLRARVPGGVISAKQWEAIDKIARELTGGGLRLTTQHISISWNIKTKCKTFDSRYK